ncbi:MAG: glycosyltransferase family 2 protein [Thermoplasmata archaeon]|nr:glycosyltransferase family 2 protein [Thermoplasmata archaeon]
MKVSVIIPTMNEEASIGGVIQTIKDAFAAANVSIFTKNPLDYEILIVDTNSKDRTRDIARERGAVVIDEPRRGYGRAYKTGFEKASGDIIATLDGDSTYPAEKIPEFVNLLLKEDLDFITCDRLSTLKPGVMSFKHRLGNKILTLTCNLLFGVKIKDSQSGMWIFRKEILKKLRVESDGMPFSEEIKVEAFRKCARCVEIPIEYRVRKGEVKLSSWKDGTKNLKYLFTMKFRK